MSEYPEDVMKAARECADLCLYTTDERMAGHIARAIMAERERCADLSKSEADDYKAHDCLPQAMALFQFAREVMKPPSSAASSSPAHPSEQEPDRRQPAYSADGA